MSTLKVSTIAPLGTDATNTVSLQAGAKTSGFGKIAQIVQGSTTTATNIASTSFSDTGLSASITPSSTSSKILVVVNQNIVTDIDSNLANSKIQLLRDSTTVISWGENIARIEAGNQSAVKFGSLVTFNYLDSPASTSSITYKTQGAISSTSNNGTSRYQNGSVSSLITLMEVLD